MKKILKYLLVFIIMIICFCVTLTLTSLIPKEYITNKVSESSKILNSETNRLFIQIKSKNLYMMFDNYSDSLMINTAYSINNKTPFYSVMMARKNYIDGKTEIIYPDSTGELKSASKYSELDQVGELNDTVNNDITESFEYARYWHGYLIILRPLLIFFNITEIRNILLVLFAILGITLLYKIYKKIDLGTAIIFLLGMIICDYFYIGFSLQGASVFLIATIASIILLSRDIKDKPMFFMIIGGLASFFDLLTVPIVTFGIPLLIYSALQFKEKYDLKVLLIEILKYCIFWGIGFLGVWFIKWVLVDLLYNKGLIQTSINQFMYRTESTENLSLKFLEIINRNLMAVKSIFGISIVVVIICTFLKISKLGNIKNIFWNIKEIIIYLIIGFIVICWYFIFKQHSYQHCFFTYRNFWVISTSVLLIIYNILRIDKGKKDDEKNEENI